MPVYVFRCDEHGEAEEHRPMARVADVSRCWCGAIRARVFRMPNISADALPVRMGATAHANARDRQLGHDRDAYKRMRHDGLQPRAVKGAAHIERHADTVHEVEMGRIMPTRLVKEGVDLAQRVVEKDLEV